MNDLSLNIDTGQVNKANVFSCRKDSWTRLNAAPMYELNEAFRASLTVRS